MQKIHLNGDLFDPESLIVQGGCCNVVDGNVINDITLKKSQHLSEFITEVDKALARKNLGIPDDFTLKWGNLKGNIEEQKDLWIQLQLILESITDLENKVETDLQDTIKQLKLELATKITKELEGESASEQIEYSNVEFPNIKNMKDALDQVLYKDLVINLSCNPNIVEDGQQLSEIKYNWSLNKSHIVSQTLDDIIIDNQLRQYTLNGPFVKTVSKTLKVNDGTKEYSASATTYFYPGLYFGTSNKEELTDSDILKFNKKLLANRYSTVTVNADSQSYIYICIPYIYGAATFKVGGFEGGFLLLNDNYIFNRYKEIRYRIYKSENKGLGNTTITIQ